MLVLFEGLTELFGQLRQVLLLRYVLTSHKMHLTSFVISAAHLTQFEGQLRQAMLELF